MPPCVGIVIDGAIVKQLQMIVQDQLPTEGDGEAGKGR